MKNNYDLLLSKMAKKLVPYKWEEGIGKDWLRFDSNTLPFPPKSIDAFLLEMKNECAVNEYADPTYKKLKELLSQYEKTSLSKITITNSGDEAIDILGKAFLNPGDYFITTPPTYEMFSIQCGINNGKEIQIPLKPITFEVNTEEIIRKAKKSKVKIIFLVNPNNPTGSVIPQKTIEYILQNTECVVVVDEAYREFYGKSAVALINKYEKLVILRSFSKFAGLAGARIGYLLAGERLSIIFDGIRFPMGVSYLSYKLAEVVLEKDFTWIKDQVNLIKQERKRLVNEISLLGYKVYPSFANFLLVNFGKNASLVCQKLREKKIIVRDRSKKKYLEGCVRITVRSPKENNQLISELKKIKSERKIAFLDRDGTLIFEPQDTFQVDSVKKLKILDGVIDGLRVLISSGYELVLVTNQDGLGTASFPTKDFLKPQNKMLKILKENGITFKKIFVCPHLPSQNCDCRKPKIGLLKGLFKSESLDVKSFVCGDRITDKQFAKNLGVSFMQMKTNGNFLKALKQGGVL